MFLLEIICAVIIAFGVFAGFGTLIYYTIVTWLELSKY